MKLEKMNAYIRKHPVLMAFAAVVLFASVLWFSWAFFCDTQLRLAMRELESRGVSCRLEVLDARQKPEWQAFTSEFRRIAEKLSKETEKNRDSRYDFLSPEQMETLYRTKPELIREADRLFDENPNAGFFRRYVPGKLFAIELTELNSSRMLIRFFGDRFSRELRRGAPAEAAKAFERGDVIRRCLVKDPFLISALVAIACESLRTDMLFKCAAAGDLGRFDGAALRRWAGQLAEAETEIRGGMKTAFEGEALFALDFSSMPAEALQGRLELQPEIAKVAAPLYLPFLKLGLSGMIRTMAELIPLASRDMLPADRARIAALCTVGGSGKASPLIRLVSKGDPTYFSTAADRASKLYAKFRILRTGLAVELFRRKHGRLPETPAELVPEFLPEVPVNPFTGKPPVIETVPPGGAEERGSVSGYQVRFADSPDSSVWDCPVKEKER
ncbi:MAG: hypothetical protein HPZ91_19985 [Lentisphaeria bacterium]|nr:hypothetical protein [Lentisphaeria bacterium]